MRGYRNAIMSFGNPAGTNDVWPFLLACLTDFVTDCGVSCRFALFVAHPLKQDEGVEDACSETNRC
jgi:hypothetical protein